MTLDLNKPSDARRYIESWAEAQGYALEDVDPDLDDYECLVLAYQLFMYAEKQEAIGSSH